MENLRHLDVYLRCLRALNGISSRPRHDGGDWLLIRGGPWPPPGGGVRSDAEPAQDQVQQREGEE
jgi:hypothetical protein